MIAHVLTFNHVMAKCIIIQWAAKKLLCLCYVLNVVCFVFLGMCSGKIEKNAIRKELFEPVCVKGRQKNVLSIFQNSEGLNEH